MRGYFNESSLPNQSSVMSHEESCSAHEAADIETGFPYNVMDSDITVPAVRLKCFVDDCLSYLTGLGLLFYRQASQCFSKDVWNRDISKIDAVNTEPPSAPTRTCISGCYNFLIDDS